MTVKVTLPPTHHPYLEDGPLPADFYNYEELLSDSEREKVHRLREFFRTEAAPIVEDYWARAEFPFELVKGFAKLDLFDWADPASSEPAPSNLLTGILSMETAHTDPSLSVFLRRAQRPRHRHHLTCGSRSSAPVSSAMATFRQDRRLQLTEPTVGPDWPAGWRPPPAATATSGSSTAPSARSATARRRSGGRMGRDVEHRPGAGLRGREGHARRSARRKIENRVALRIVPNADIVLEDCRVPEANRLQNANSFRDTAEILRRTRSGVAWQSVGVQFAAYEIALQYAKERVQFGKPIGKFQMVQDLLVKMLGNATACAG